MQTKERNRKPSDEWTLERSRSWNISVRVWSQTDRRTHLQHVWTQSEGEITHLFTMKFTVCICGAAEELNVITLEEQRHRHHHVNAVISVSARFRNHFLHYGFGIIEKKSFSKARAWLSYSNDSCVVQHTFKEIKWKAQHTHGINCQRKSMKVLKVFEAQYTLCPRTDEVKYRSECVRLYNTHSAGQSVCVCTCFTSGEGYRTLLGRVELRLWAGAWRSRDSIIFLSLCLCSSVRGGCRTLLWIWRNKNNNYI